MTKQILRLFVPAMFLASILAISACRSHHIDAMIENRTGAAIHQVEVDYPSASFGVNVLSPGQFYMYKFQVQGNGPLKVQYSNADGKQVELIGATLHEGDQGQYLVILLPDGKAKWVPSINPKV